MVATHVPKNPLLKNMRQNLHQFLRSLTKTSVRSPQERRRGSRLETAPARLLPAGLQDDAAGLSRMKAPALSRMNDCMSRLPAEQRAMLVIVCVQGRSYEEAAGILRMPVGKLRTRLSGARQRLQQLEEAWETGKPTPDAGYLSRTSGGF